MDVDDVGLGVEVIFPDLLQQHGPRHSLAGVAHHELQQLELARLQVDLLALAMHGPGDQVHLQVAVTQQGLDRAGLAPAGQGRDAGDQLGEGVGVDQIGVAAGLQPVDAVVDLAERREEEDRRLVPLAPQGLDQGHPIHLRHHAVDDHHVELAGPRLGQAGLAVGGRDAVVAAFGEAANHGARRFEIVFDNQDPHDSRPRWIAELSP